MSRGGHLGMLGTVTPKDEARELRGFREAMKALAIVEGFILTNDEERELTFEGARIQIMPAWKWLGAKHAEGRWR